MKKFPLLFFAVVLLLGCTSSKKMKNTTQNSPLVSTYWELYSIAGNPVDESSPKTPYIVFDTNGTCYGSLGCNRFFGTYFANDKKKISIEYSGATKMLCSDMQTEKLFSSALRKEIKHYKIERNMLLLMNKDEEVMKFYAVSKIEKE